MSSSIGSENTTFVKNTTEFTLEKTALGHDIKRVGRVAVDNMETHLSPRPRTYPTMDMTANDRV